MDEMIECWDDYPMEHGCICGNDCDPPQWMIEQWRAEHRAEL